MAFFSMVSVETATDISAIQQAAGAAMAASYAIIPYCFARAVSEIHRINNEGKAEPTPQPE